jgi:hypothetical protein
MVRGEEILGPQRISVEPIDVSFFIPATRGALVAGKAEEFRNKAALCARMARQTRDPDLRRELEELAQGWLHLAEHAERPDPTVRFISRSNDDDD